MDSKSKLSRPSSDPGSLVTLKEHLKTNNNGQCSRSCVQVNNIIVFPFCQIDNNCYVEF